MEIVRHDKLNPEALRRLHLSYRLGKRAPSRKVTLPFSRYLKANLAPPPISISWIAAQIIWTMLLNDTLGDCTIAAFLHMVQAWAAAVGIVYNPTDATALAMYEAACGYVPGDPATDQGGVETTVLDYARSTGAAGHKILAYVSVDPANQTEVETAIAIFGGVYTGLAMPTAWQGALLWDVAPGGLAGKLKRFLSGDRSWAPGSWGGHAVPFLAYAATGVYQLITWGSSAYRITPAAVATYCDEMYAAVSPDFINAKGLDPAGFDLAQLEADLKILAA